MKTLFTTVSSFPTKPTASVSCMPFRAPTRKLSLAIAVVLSGIVAPAAFAQGYGGPGYGYGPPQGYGSAPPVPPGYGRPGYGHAPPVPPGDGRPGYGYGPGAQGSGMTASPQQAPQAVEAAGVATQQAPEAAEAAGVAKQQGVAQAHDHRVIGQGTSQKTSQREGPAGIEQQVRQADTAVQGAAQQPSQGEGEGATLRTTVSVDVPEPVVTVNQSDSIVDVQQGQAQVAVNPGRPQVTVNQSAPQVRVSMPQPKITIDMPPPDILMEMPNPTVSVNVPQPRVSVTQAAPTVTVEQGKPQVQVGSDASKGTGQPDVRVEKGQPQVKMSDAQQATVSISEVQPQVHYNATQPEVRISSEGEPQVQFNQPGEPRIQIRQMSAEETLKISKQQASQMQDQTAAPSKPAAQPAAQPAADGQARDGANTAVSAAAMRDIQLTVGDITGYAIVDSRVKKLGDIDKVVSVNNRLYAVIGSGGFLGFGGKEVAIVLSSLVLSDNALMASEVPGRRIVTLDGFKSDAYPALEDKYPVTMGSM